MPLPPAPRFEPHTLRLHPRAHIGRQAPSYPRRDGGRSRRLDVPLSADAPLAVHGSSPVHQKLCCVLSAEGGRWARGVRPVVLLGVAPTRRIWAVSPIAVTGTIAAIDVRRSVARAMSRITSIHPFPRLGEMPGGNESLEFLECSGSNFGPLLVGHVAPGSRRVVLHMSLRWAGASTSSPASSVGVMTARPRRSIRIRRYRRGRPSVRPRRARGAPGA